MAKKRTNNFIAIAVAVSTEPNVNERPNEHKTSESPAEQERGLELWYETKPKLSRYFPMTFPLFRIVSRMLLRLSTHRAINILERPGTMSKNNLRGIYPE